MAGPEKIKSILKNLVDVDSLTKIAKANYELEQILSGTIPPEIEEDVFFGHHPLEKDRFESCWSQLDEFHRIVQTPNS